MPSSTAKKSLPKSKAKPASVKVSKKTVAKSTPAKRPARAANGSRQLQVPKKRFRRVPKKFRPSAAEFAGSFFVCCGGRLDSLKKHWKLFLGITLVYGVLNIILVRGLGVGTNLSTLKSTLDQTLNGHASKLSTGFTVFVYLLGGAGNSSSSQTAGVYQAFARDRDEFGGDLEFAPSLREGTHSACATGFTAASIRSFRSCLVLLVIGLQLLPIARRRRALPARLLAMALPCKLTKRSSGPRCFFLLALASLYMICSSIFALYIVTLPDMTPMKALRSARELVRYRRFTILRKLLFLPLGLLILAALVMIPLIIWLTPPPPGSTSPSACSPGHRPQLPLRPSYRELLQ